MKKIKEQGAAAEAALNKWLKENKLSYVAVCQAKDTFSPLFTGDVKRPDFLLLFESIGLIAVDVKNYKLSGGGYTLKLEDELKRSLVFERLFRIPLWYAYFDDTDGVESWYWISALKAVEVGESRSNGKTKEQFIFIKRSECEHIVEATDFAKLYTHRLPGVSKIAAT